MRQEPTRQSAFARTSRALATANDEIAACGYKPNRVLETALEHLSRSSAFVTDSATAADYLALCRIDGTADHGWATVIHGTGPGGERFIVVSDCNGHATITTDL